MPDDSSSRSDLGDAPGRDPDRSPEPADMLRPLFREEPLPPEGAEPPQMWLWMLIFGVLLFGTFYLGLYIGDFSPDPWLQSSETRAEGSAAAEEEAVSGEQIYGARCSTCHQSNGQGVSNQFPTLIGTQWVENKGMVIRILLHGMQGEMEVQGETYNGNMPAWGASLSDAEIAAVITYVRQAWDNDYSEVTEEEVAAVRSATDGRSEQWTADELLESDNQTVPTEDDETTAQAREETRGARLYDRLVARRPSRSASGN